MDKKYEQAKAKQRRLFDFRKRNIFWTLLNLKRLEEFFQLSRNQKHCKARGVESFIQLLEMAMGFSRYQATVAFTGQEPISERHKSNLNQFFDPHVDERRRLKRAVEDINQEIGILKSKPFETMAEFEERQEELEAKQIELNKVKEDREKVPDSEGIPISIYEFPSQQALIARKLIERNGAGHYLTDMGAGAVENSYQLKSLIDNLSVRHIPITDDKKMKIWARMKTALKSGAQAPFELMTN